MAEEGRKREFRIDSSDSARPPVTIQDEPRYFSDIKPKKRHMVARFYEETGETAKTRVGKPVKIILKSTVYNDGVLTQQTVGEDNEDYQEFLRTGDAMPQNESNAPEVHAVSADVQKALDAAKGTAKKKAPAKKEA